MQPTSPGNRQPIQSVAQAPEGDGTERPQLAHASRTAHAALALDQTRSSGLLRTAVVAYLVLQLGLAFTPDEPVVASTRLAKLRPAPPTKPAPPANEAELEKVLLDSMRAARDKLEAARRPIPDEQNSATVIARAAPLIPKEAFSNTEYLIGIGLLSPSTTLNDKHLALVKDDLGSCAEALAALHSLPERAGGRFPPPEQLFGNDYCKDSRRCADLLRWQATLQAHRQEADAAVVSSRAVLNAGRSIGDDPALASQLVRLACQGMAVKTLERILGQGTPSAQNLKAAQTQLEEEAKEPLFLIAAQGERELQLALHAKIEALDVPLPTRMLWFNDQENETIPVDKLKSTHRTVRRLTFELVRLAKRPVHEWWSAAAEITNEYSKATPLEKHVLFVHCTVLPKQFVRAQARLRCANVGLAVERYRLAR